METFMTNTITNMRTGYIRSGKVKVMPVRRSSDWLPENSDSAFMNTGAKIEYVVPRSQRTGQLIDPLAELTEEQKSTVARQLGLKTADDLNIMKDRKENFWINRAVIIDKNGLFLDLSNIGDFISWKILSINSDFIAPSWEDRYNKGTYKFALVFEEEEAKLNNAKIDTKKEAYMSFGKIDGSVKKLSDFLWIYYLTSKDGKRLPLNPTLDYLRSEVGMIIEDKPGVFLSIITDPNFDTKALIQKSINIGLIQRDGLMFKIFGEDSSANTLDGLIAFLLDERNNNIRLSLIGKIENTQEEAKIKPSIDPSLREAVTSPQKVEDLSSKIDSMEKMIKDTLMENQRLKEELAKASVKVPEETEGVETRSIKRGRKKAE